MTKNITKHSFNMSVLEKKLLFHIFRVGRQQSHDKCIVNVGVLADPRYATT